MRFQNRFRSLESSPLFVITVLVLGMMLAAGGSVFATSVGNSIGVTNDLTVAGSTGAGTTSPGTVFSIQGAGNFKVGTSTIYSDLLFPSFTATSTRASGVATSSPSTLFSIQGVANFVPDATSTIYSILTFPSFAATSTTATSTFGIGGFRIGSPLNSHEAHFIVQQRSGHVGIGTTSPGAAFSVATSSQGTAFLLSNTGTNATFWAEDAANDSSPFVIDTAGNVGVGTTTPGTIFGIDKVASFSSGTSTIESSLRVTNFAATSTSATSTISTGGFQVGQAGALAAFTVGQSATTSVGVGTSTPTSHQFAVGGNALIGAGSNGTSTLAINASGTGVGSCIEMRAASTSAIFRIYLGNPVAAQGNFGTSGLIVEPGTCR